MVAVHTDLPYWVDPVWITDGTWSRYWGVSGSSDGSPLGQTQFECQDSVLCTRRDQPRLSVGSKRRLIDMWFSIRLADPCSTPAFNIQIFNADPCRQITLSSLDCIMTPLYADVDSWLSISDIPFFHHRAGAQRR